MRIFVWMYKIVAAVIVVFLCIPLSAHSQDSLQINCRAYHLLDTQWTLKVKDDVPPKMALTTLYDRSNSVLGDRGKVLSPHFTLADSGSKLSPILVFDGTPLFHYYRYEMKGCATKQLDTFFAFQIIDKGRKEDKPQNVPKAAPLPVFKEPVYIDGEAALNEFIVKNIKLPESWEPCRIYVQFQVDTAGNVLKPVLSESCGVDLDKEIVRVVHLLKFHPATRDGIPVKTILRLPFRFD